jgi:hypothetical protein
MDPPYFFVTNERIEGLPYSTETLTGRYGIMEKGEFYGIAYYKAEDWVKEIFLHTLVPKELHSDFDVAYMVINTKYAPPHTDSGILMTINYYVETADAETKFWKENKDTRRIKLSAESDGFIYDESTLDLLGSFKASQHDIWALRVKDIHSVECKGLVRTAYCLQSSTVTFEDFVQRRAISLHSDQSE